MLFFSICLFWSGKMYFEHIVGYAAEKDRIDGIVKIIDSGEKICLNQHGLH